VTIIAAFHLTKRRMRRSMCSSPGKPRLGLAGDGVDVGSADGGGEAHLALTGTIEQFTQQEPGPRLAVYVDDGIEAVEPLPRFAGVDVGELVHVTVEGHGQQSATATRE